MSGVRGWDRDVLTLLMAPLEGTTLPDWAGEALDAGLGSIILFGYNTPDPETAAALAASIHERCDEVLVAIDEEGGDVSRLQAATGSSLPSAWAFGQIDEVALTARAGEALGELLAACDMDLVLSPVLDVSTDPANPVIGTRSYGDDPDRVSRHGRAMASGLRSAGLGVTGKHFPGHGATSVDSHTALPRIDLDARDMRREHLAPFQIAPWLDAVMTAHILVPSLGEGPASLSRWSTTLLDEVSGNGFHGLVVTDALDMAAVAADPGFGEAAVRALEAGAHLLCLGTSLRRDAAQMVREAHDAILAAFDAGRLDREEIGRRAAQTRAAIRSLRIRRGVEPRRSIPDALRELEEIGADAARRAVTARHAALGGGPVVVADARVRADHASGSRSPHLVGAFRERGIDVTEAQYPGDLSGAAEVLVVTRLPRSDAAEAERVAEALRVRPDAILVHTGVPDAALDHRESVSTLGSSLTMMRAAVDLLLRAGREPR
ncbi:beta-glucosidase [Brachybacterium halotolerans subsp. kimchii]|uniref:glycoside hydrolase family 3 N-terminal domain-containing protein n=1 Tax=Brachybacterium halotolerans TaxID=2795215 RepID=UPI001E65D44E|nr:glycoside hydrolase family 3 N-terminal domain-containing protein [Brachybacterium halotolerans]UEJ84066.1 beta-glucosidase [Brachybacterium halotolerans subsp. kimchii]